MATSSELAKEIIRRRPEMQGMQYFLELEIVTQHEGETKMTIDTVVKGAIARKNNNEELNQRKTMRKVAKYIVEAIDEVRMRLFLQSQNDPKELEWITIIDINDMKKAKKIIDFMVNKGLAFRVNYGHGHVLMVTKKFINTRISYLGEDFKEVFSSFSEYKEYSKIVERFSNEYNKQKNKTNEICYF